MRFRLSLALGLTILGGCATENPQWLAQPHSAHCLRGVEETCIRAFGDAELKDAIGSHSEHPHVPKLAFAISLYGLNAESFEELPLPAQAQAFVDAGGLVAQADEATGETIVRALQEIEDPQAKAYALSMLLVLKGHELQQATIGEALNTLYLVDRAKYVTGISGRLTALLRQRDLERAAALRPELIQAEGDPARPFSMLPLVVGAYSRAGLEADALALLASESIAGRKFTDDEVKLIKLVSQVAVDGYPSSHDFLTFRSDQVRLEAYLTVATLSLLLGEPETAEQAISDGLRFIQKSSVDVDKRLALGNLMALSYATERLSTKIHE